MPAFCLLLILYPILYNQIENRENSTVGSYWSEKNNKVFVSHSWNSPILSKKNEICLQHSYFIFLTNQNKKLVYRIQFTTCFHEFFAKLSLFVYFYVLNVNRFVWLQKLQIFLNFITNYLRHNHYKNSWYVYGFVFSELVVGSGEQNMHSKRVLFFS
jgi:hypothetical protein